MTSLEMIMRDIEDRIRVLRREFDYGNTTHDVEIYGRILELQRMKLGIQNYIWMFAKGGHTNE